MRKQSIALILAIALTGCLGSPESGEQENQEATALIGELQTRANVEGSPSAMSSLRDKCGKPGNAPNRRCPRVYIRGDVNADGHLTKDDNSLFTQAVHNVAGFYCPAVLDVNLDGWVNQADVGAFHDGLNAYLNGGELPWRSSLFIKEGDCQKVQK